MLSTRQQAGHFTWDSSFLLSTFVSKADTITATHSCPASSDGENKTHILKSFIWWVAELPFKPRSAKDRDSNLLANFYLIAIPTSTPQQNSQAAVITASFMITSEVPSVARQVSCSLCTLGFPFSFFSVQKAGPSPQLCLRPVGWQIGGRLTLHGTSLLPETSEVSEWCHWWEAQGKEEINVWWVLTLCQALFWAFYLMGLI